MREHIKQNKNRNTLIRRCHVCGQIAESQKEEVKCLKCDKAFLPLSYFHKIHDHHENFDELFSHVEELEDYQLIKGLFVIW